MGYYWKGVNYIRAHAMHIKDPKSQRQQQQRSKLIIMTDFLQSMMPYIRIGYRHQTQYARAYNAALAYLMRHALVEQEGEIKIDYEKVLVARGCLTPAFNVRISRSDNVLLFSWENNSGCGDARETDLAMPLAYNKKTGESIYLLAAAKRSVGTTTLQLPESWAGAPLAVYLAFCSKDGSSQSNGICWMNDPE